MQFALISASSLLPQLLRIEDEIELAIENKSTLLLRHAIMNWHFQAGMCREFLDSEVEQESKAMENIQRSIVAAKGLKQDIPGFDLNTDWVEATKRVRKSVGDVTAIVGSITASKAIKE
ncbi:hypothetical protein [Gordonia sputi]|uniref:hypothetical protein n=1 Tax=Gordonia sputi TaxID=36823 RepID=UPI00226EB681|nr:hypothetical protein [Gordonia sputi]